ncbi:hypothetical protein ACHWQZ_G002980 [Mnemiopsis leidyi]
MTIRSRPNHPEASELIDYHDQFIKRQSVLDETIQADIESIGFRLKTKTDAIQNKFISSFTEPYNWSSSKGTVVNEAASITNYPGIQGLMEEINATFGLKMNSVLVSCYASGHVCARAHDDGESVLDPNQPICVVSFGAVRKVEFISKWSTDPQRSDYCLEPKDGSLYVMKPGCQTYFKHRVRRDKKLNDCRISLSFRCFKPAGTTVEETVVPKAPAPTEVKTTPPSFSLPTSTPKLDDAPMGFSPFLGHQTFYGNGSNDWSNSDTDKVCLLFGSSITTRVEESRMKRGSRTLINLSKSGAKICDLIGLADKFCIDQPDKRPRSYNIAYPKAKKQELLPPVTKHSHPKEKPRDYEIKPNPSPQKDDGQADENLRIVDSYYDDGQADEGLQVIDSYDNDGQSDDGLTVVDSIDRVDYKQL